MVEKTETWNFQESRSPAVMTKAIPHSIGTLSFMLLQVSLFAGANSFIAHNIFD
jgi:hypothetical protein